MRTGPSPLCGTFAKRAMEAVDRHVADTETEAHLKRLREVIRTAGVKGITKSELTRGTQWLKSRTATTSSRP
ncbi:MAG: hypothetical protein IPF97_15125 [Sphingomonadales bacterium]|nr:hypothetical protein [Sphingomonadales bacterium]